MNRVMRVLFSHMRLTPEERERTELLRSAAVAQQGQAQEMAKKIQRMQERNHFGERIRKAFEAAEGSA